MDTVKYELKFFVDDTSGVDLEEFIPIFHHWIQNQELEELLIDVADYRHVPDGPGVVLITHDAHYAMDLADGRLGLLYSRRRETHPRLRDIQSIEDRLRSVWQCALTACQRLAAHPAPRSVSRRSNVAQLTPCRMTRSCVGCNTSAIGTDSSQAQPYFATRGSKDVPYSLSMLPH